MLVSRVGWVVVGLLLVGGSASAGIMEVVATRRCVSESGVGYCNNKGAGSVGGLQLSVTLRGRRLALLVKNVSKKPVTFVKSYGCSGLKHVKVDGRPLPGQKKCKGADVPQWVTVRPGGSVPIRFPGPTWSTGNWKAMQSRGVQVTMGLTAKGGKGGTLTTGRVWAPDWK